MTEFEKAVAEALLTLDDVEEIVAVLDPSGHYADDGYLPEVRVALVQRLAPRVAAAIAALGPRDHMGCAPLCVTCRSRALAALRGTSGETPQ